MNKEYIFFTADIHFLGGMEMYSAGKASYLEKMGWNVIIFHPGIPQGNTIIPSLKKFLTIGALGPSVYTPPYRYSKVEQEIILNNMLDRLIFKNGDENEIIIESHVDVEAYWAELLAARIKAKHYFVCCNEVYRPLGRQFTDRFYEENLNFFYFKWDRNELLGLPDDIKRLFNGYKNISKTKFEITHRITQEQYAVQDVYDSRVEKIEKKDFNICYMGRTRKQYVPNVIKGVAEFARKYSNKTINFIIVGNATFQIDLLKSEFNALNNVSITLCGDMVPIPKSIFGKIDVVLAGSQTARFAADSGGLVIVCNADISLGETSGVLGYDTIDQMFINERVYTYSEALENVLINKLYANKQYVLEKLKPESYYYKQTFELFKNASTEKKYFIDELSREKKRNFIYLFPFSKVPKSSKIILYGATEIRRDYILQVEGQKYCSILYTVDDNYINFDDSVVSINTLKYTEFDLIVITEYQASAEKSYKKIISMFPEFNGKIIYDIHLIRI